jgi:putative Mn2+ efflux pump MntP
MDIHHLWLLLALLIPLTLDTFILSAALGVAGLPKHRRLRTSLTLATFEAVMPAVGVLLGEGLGDALGRFAGYTAAALIGLAGFIILKPGVQVEKVRKRMKLVAHTRGVAIIDLGLSISLDELAIGFSLGLLKIPLAVAVVFIGLQAFLASQLGLKLGGHLSERLRDRAERVGGLVLIGIAIILIGLKLGGDQF